MLLLVYDYIYYALLFVICYIPVVLVFWPLTRRPKWCLTPLCALIFFNLSKSSLNLTSIWLARQWEYLPSLISFCLLRNQVGILYCLGWFMMVVNLSTSSFESSPALFEVSISAFLQTKLANLRPTPLTQVRAYWIFLLPSTLVL